MEVLFCPHCSQVVNINYLYCPHCGNKLRIEKGLSEILSESLEPLVKEENQRHLEKLQALLCRLTLLEENLDEFLEEQPGKLGENWGSSTGIVQTKK